MSHGKLRENITCQNCGDTVNARFCPSCGQENTETKKSFHYLFTHFLEDLVHYESSFWNAIKYLMYAPEKLTNTYLSGKRKAFMAPVRLFIFINIASFFIFNAFTFKEITSEINSELATGLMQQESHSNNSNKQIIKEKEKNTKSLEINSNSTFLEQKFKQLEKHYTKTQIIKKVFQKVFQNLPKFLFIIMPFFALTLWLTHNKKKWWYFDHGIFTFHFFSSFLLILSLATITNQILGIINYETNDNFGGILFLYLNFLFIKAFLVFYKESKLKSFLKLSIIYVLNAIILFFIFLLFAFYIILIL